MASTLPSLHFKPTKKYILACEGVHPINDADRVQSKKKTLGLNIDYKNSSITFSRRLKLTDRSGRERAQMKRFNLDHIVHSLAHGLKDYLYNNFVEPLFSGINSTIFLGKSANTSYQFSASQIFLKIIQKLFVASSSSNNFSKCQIEVSVFAVDSTKKIMNIAQQENSNYNKKSTSSSPRFVEISESKFTLLDLKNCLAKRNLERFASSNISYVIRTTTATKIIGNRVKKNAVFSMVDMCPFNARNEHQTSKYQFQKVFRTILNSSMKSENLLNKTQSNIRPSSAPYLTDRQSLVNCNQAFIALTDLQNEDLEGLRRVLDFIFSFKPSASSKRPQSAPPIVSDCIIETEKMKIQRLNRNIKYLQKELSIKQMVNSTENTGKSNVCNSLTSANLLEIDSSSINDNINKLIQTAPENSDEYLNNLSISSPTEAKLYLRALKTTIDNQNTQIENLNSKQSEARSVLANQHKHTHISAKHTKKGTHASNHQLTQAKKIQYADAECNTTETFGALKSKWLHFYPKNSHDKAADLNANATHEIETVKFSFYKSTTGEKTYNRLLSLKSRLKRLETNFGKFFNQNTSPSENFKWSENFVDEIFCSGNKENQMVVLQLQSEMSSVRQQIYACRQELLRGYELSENEINSNHAMIAATA